MNPVAQLQERYAKLEQSKNISFVDALLDYLVFAKTNPVFSYFIQGGKCSTGMGDMFKKLEAHFSGDESATKFFYSMIDIRSVRPVVPTFHLHLLSHARSQGVFIQDKIIIINSNIQQKLCRLDSVAECYVFRGVNTDRFKIIMALHNTKHGRTTNELLEIVSTSESSNLRKTIKQINARFKDVLSVDKDLILFTQKGNQNYYFLNRNDYSFEIKN